MLLIDRNNLLVRVRPVYLDRVDPSVCHLMFRLITISFVYARNYLIRLHLPFLSVLSSIRALSAPEIGSRPVQFHIFNFFLLYSTFVFRFHQSKSHSLSISSFCPAFSFFMVSTVLSLDLDHFGFRRLSNSCFRSSEFHFFCSVGHNLTNFLSFFSLFGLPD